MRKGEGKGREFVLCSRKKKEKSAPMFNAVFGVYHSPTYPLSYDAKHGPNSQILS